MSNNVLFVFEAPETPTDGPVVTLDEGVDAGVRGRSGSSSRDATRTPSPRPASRSSSSPRSISGTAIVHPYILSPPVEAQIPMRQTMEAGCEALGKVVFAGEE